MLVFHARCFWNYSICYISHNSRVNFHFSKHIFKLLFSYKSRSQNSWHIFTQINYGRFHAYIHCVISYNHIDSSIHIMNYMFCLCRARLTRNIRTRCCYIYTGCFNEPCSHRMTRHSYSNRSKTTCYAVWNYIFLFKNHREWSRPESLCCLYCHIIYIT